MSLLDRYEKWKKEQWDGTLPEKKSNEPVFEYKPSKAKTIGERFEDYKKQRADYQTQLEAYQKSIRPPDTSYQLRTPTKPKPLPLPTLEEQYRQTYSKPMPLAVDRDRMQDMIGNSLLEHTRQKNEAIKNFQPTLKPADRSYTQRTLTKIPGRNVDLDLNFDSLDEDYEYEEGTKRPIVRLNETNKKAFESYYDFPEDVKELEGQTMTYFSNLYGDKEGRQVLLTPIKPDGTVMTASDLKKYYNLITQDGPENIKKNDRYGLVMGVFDQGDEQANIREANEAAKMYSAYSQDSLVREGNAYKMQSALSPKGFKTPDSFTDPRMDIHNRMLFAEETMHDPMEVKRAKYSGEYQGMTDIQQYEFSNKAIDRELGDLEAELEKIAGKMSHAEKFGAGVFEEYSLSADAMFKSMEAKPREAASDEDVAKWEESLERLRQMADDELSTYGQTDKWKSLLKTIDETKKAIRGRELPDIYQGEDERDPFSQIEMLEAEDKTPALSAEAQKINDRISLLKSNKLINDTGIEFIKVNEKYDVLWNNKDFIEKSQYDASKRPNGLYAAVNAKTQGYYRPDREDAYEGEGVYQLSPKEVFEFNYLFNTDGDYKQYLKDKKPQLYLRRTGELSEAWAETAKKHPAFAYMGARLANMGKWAFAPAQMAAHFLGADKNDPIFDANRMSQVMDATNREAASKWFGGAKIPVLNTTVGELTYSLMSSGVDSAVAIGVAKALDVSQKATNMAVHTIMSGGVLSDSLKEYKERDFDNATAAFMAVGQALLSVATEDYSLETLFNSSGPFWKQVLKNFFAEMTEEQAESIGKRISESILLGDRSEIQERINQLQRENKMSATDAKAQANEEWWQEFGVESIVGGLTGGIFGAAHWAGTRNTTNKAASNIVKKGNVGDLKVFAGRMGIETNINEQSSAQEVKKVTAQVYDQLIENAAAAKTPAEESAVSRDFQLFSGLTLSAQEKAEQLKAALEGMVQKAGQALEDAISEKTAEDLKKIASPLPGEAGELAKILDTKKPGLPADLIRSTIQALGERADVLIEAVKADITEKLSRMGEKAEKSPAVAEAVMSYLTGQEQTAEQKQAIAGSEAGSKLVESLLIEEGRREMAARERAETEERERRDRAEYERVLATLEAEKDIQGELKAEVEKSPEKVRQVLTGFELARVGVAEEIVTKLTGAAKQVYELGQRAWNSQLEARKEAAKQTQLRMHKPGEGVVTDHESVNRDSWTQEQRSAVALAEQIAKDSGYTLNIFQSAPVEGVYRAENGSYISEDGSIWLDVNAGKIREGDAGQTILPTFTHELVHHLLHAVPELGREYIGYTVDKMAEDGRDVVAKINEKIQRSIEARREIGIAKAIEEVVADSSNMILRDSKAVEQMARKHPKLFSEIKNYIKDYVNRMREAFKRLSPVYDETKWLMKSVEGRLKYADEQVALFDRMMVAEVEARVQLSLDEAAPITEPVRTAPAVQETAERVAGKGTAYTSDGQAVPYHYEAVPISGLVASNIESTMETNPDYPQELQPRDRTRVASRQQIDRIANSLNPGMLGASADVGTGAPIVGADMVVESGNGRILGLERAMRQGKAAAYTQWLRENAAQFGLQAGDIQGDSVLVRVRDSDADRVDFVRRANESQVAAYSDTESAATDAAKIKPGLLDLADMSGGEIDTAGNARFIARFVSEVVPRTEQGRMMDSEGKLGKTGEARIRNALFQLAYGDGYLTEQLAEATDAESRNMIRAMTGIAPRMAAMNTDMQRGLMHELDIGSQIAEAYRTVLRQKLAGVGVDEYLAQTTMLEELPKAQRMLLEMFAEHKRSAVKMNDALDSILDAVEAQGDPRQLGMLGDAGKPTVEGAIAEGLREFRAGLEDRKAASERYSLRELPDGTKYVHVDTDQDLFDKASPDQYGRIARRYIMEHYSGKVIGDSTRAYVRKESANEYAYPAKKNMDQSARDSKLRAATELPNIVEAGKFLRHESDRGNHPDATRGWDYYSVIYQAGGRFFEGETQIKKIERGDLFYDVTKIKDITNSFTAKYGENPQYRDLGNVSGMNITENGPDSQGEVFRSERDGIVISEDGGVVVKDANALTSEEWAQVAKGVKRLGYDIRGAEDAKTLYSREGIIRLNDDVATIIKNIIGVPAETKTVDVEAANKHREAAIEEFGYTDYFYDAGFIMPDGEMLNFSGEKDKHFGMRGQDHRAIGVVFDEKLSGTDAMIAFMNEGNIRIMDESPGIDLSADVAPTDDQLWVIEEHVRESQGRENYYVDFSNSNANSIGQYEYEGGVSPSRVVSDIKYFYRTGETRAMSDVQRFSYSERAYQAAVESKDMAEAQRLVDEAARAAGYTLQGYHGTSQQTRSYAHMGLAEETDYANKRLPFTIFKPGNSGGIYIASSRAYADAISGRADGKPGTTMGVYTRFANPLVIDEHVKTSVPFYDSIPTPSVMKEAGYTQATVSTEEISLFAQGAGYDGVIIEGIREGGGIFTNDYIAFTAEQIKSADPVTYDDSGKVIPLSERFNPAEADIRYNEREAFGFDPFSRESLNNIKMRGGIVVETRADLLHHIEQALDPDNKDMKKSLYIGAVGEQAKAKIEESVGKKVFRPREYAFVVTYDDIRHVQRHYTGADQIANAVERIYSLFDSFDTVDVYSVKKNEQRIRLDKKFSDASFRTVSIIGNTTRSFDLVTIYITKMHIEKGAQSDRSAILSPLNSFKRARTPSDNIIPESTSGKQELLSERQRDMLTNREVLAGAFDLVANTPTEKRNLAEYKRLVRRLNNMEAEAAQLRAENTADRKAKADKAVIAERAARIADLEGRIDAADRRLLKMKDAAPLRNILKREGERVSRQAVAEYKEKATERRLKMAERHDEQMSELRAKKNEQLSELRTKRDEQVSELKAKQADYRAHVADKKLRDLYAARIEKNATAMNTWLQRPDKKKYVNEAIRNNVADLLRAMNLSTVKPDGELRPSRRAKGWQEAMVSLSNLMHSMDMRSAETNMAVLMDIDPDLAADVEALVRDNDNVLMPRAMPTDQLRKLDSIVRRMKRAITMANQMHTMGRGTLVETVAQGTIDYAEARREKKLRGNVVERLSTMLNLDMSDAFTYFESLGPDAQRVLKSLYNQGFGKLVRNTEIAQTFFSELNEKYPGMANWSGKKAAVQQFDVEGGTLYLTPGHIMELYLLNQREQARGHIYGRGLRVEGHEAGKGRGHLYQKEAVRVSPADVARIIDTLTAEQRSAAEEFSSFLNTTMSDWGNEVSMRLYGYQKFIEGNYYPIRSDTSETLTRDPDTNFSMNALLNLGMTKSLTKNANNAIFIGDAFTTITKHITDMANYNAFAAPLTDAMKWFNYKQEGTNKSVKGSIERLHGRAGNAYFVNLLKAVNGIRTPTVATGFSGLLNSLAGKMKVAAVAGNARVIMQQHASYTRASAMISPAIMAQAYLRSPKRGMQMAQKYSPIAAWKHMGYFDMNIGRQMDALITGKESLTRKIQEATLMPAGVADDFTLGVLWNATEIELGQSYEGDKRSEAFYELVGERLTDIIDRTQVVDTVFHRSQVMREKDGLIKITTNFMAEPIKTYNLLMSAIRTRDVGTIARTGAATLAGWITVAMAAGLIDVTRDKEKEKGWKGAWESYLSNVFGIDGNFWESNIWDNVNPANMVPFAKEVYSMWSGYSPSRPDMQAAQRIIWAGQNWMKLFEGTYDKSAYDLIYSTAAAISSTTGLPINNIMRDTVSVIDTVNPAIIGIAGGPSAKTILQRFATAMEAGKIDEAIAYYNTLIELGKTNENARDEMMKAAKLHPTIQAAAKALDEGRYADYEKLLVQEAWLPKEMAIRAARSLLGKEETEKPVSQKAESMDDIRGAMEYTAKTYTYQNSDLSALIESGKFVDVKRVIDSMMSEGKDKSTISSAITTAFGKEYVALVLAGKKKEAAELKAKILKAYELAGYDRATKIKAIDKWVTDAQKKK